MLKNLRIKHLTDECLAVSSHIEEFISVNTDFVIMESITLNEVLNDDYKSSFYEKQ